MPDPRTDQIAREAARLIDTGHIQGVEEAIHRAATGLGFHDAPRPGRGMVRRHAQAMAMQSLGAEAYEQRRQQMRMVVEQMMTAIEHVAPDGKTLLVGRAAQGHIDAGVTIHIRIYTRATLAAIVQSLVELGYSEPTFQTSATRLGRLDQAHFTDDKFEMTLTRCLPEMMTSLGMDLHTGQPIASQTLDQLRQVLQEKPHLESE